jgi:hypothetical protein
VYGLYNAYVKVSWRETCWGYYVLVRWQLWKVSRNGDVSELYKLFEQVCSHYHLELQGQDLVDAFKKANISDAKLQEFKQLVQALLAVVFAKQQAVAKDNQQILEQGQYWMKELLRACCYVSPDSKKEWMK